MSSLQEKTLWVCYPNYISLISFNLSLNGYKPIIILTSIIAYVIPYYYYCDINVFILLFFNYDIFPDTMFIIF